MGRLTPAELEQLKRGVSLRAVAQSQGHTLKKQGADSYVCRCPFHQEKTPSCVITPSKNLYHCFGCGASGSVLDWLQHTERLTYSSRQRQGYVSAAAAELGCEASVIKRECGRVLLMLEQKQDDVRQAAEQTDATAAVTVSAEDEADALELLKSPHLAERIINDLAACGVVGESTNLLTGYLAATSRKLDKPLPPLL